MILIIFFIYFQFWLQSLYSLVTIPFEGFVVDVLSTRISVLGHGPFFVIVGGQVAVVEVGVFPFDSVDPVDPVDPVELVDPVDPVVLVDPVELVDPVVLDVLVVPVEVVDVVVQFFN